MKNTSLDLSNDRELRELAELLRTIGEAIAMPDEWLLIGATARDLILHHAHGLPIMRRTEDIDVAIAIATWSRFDAIRQLVADPVMTEGPRHRCLVGGRTVDMVPFGPIADHDTIAWPPDGDPVLNVMGFEEANESVVLVTLPRQTIVRVASIPALALLKILAWDDRHLVMPRHDGRDLRQLMLSYSEAWNVDDLYERGNAFLEMHAFDVELAGAALLGSDIASIARARTAAAIRTILRREVGDDGTLAVDMTRSADYNIRLLEALLSGFAS